MVTTNSTTAEDRLAKLGIDLAEVVNLALKVLATGGVKLLGEIPKRVLDHGSEYHGRRWVEALKAWRLARATASSEK